MNYHKPQKDIGTLLHLLARASTVVKETNFDASFSRIISLFQFDV